MIGDLLEPGDEILLTEMDHDGNVTPWLHMAERRGLTVKWLPINTETARYDLDSLEEIVNERTKFAAINYASNITGTINDVAGIVELLQKFGTLTYIDAVQYAPHGVIDVKALNCDFLVCSAYKFYGPHLGVLWAHSRILERLKPIRLQAAPAHWPQAFERGCLNSEGIAGLRGALNYYKALAKLDGYIGDSPFKHTKILMHQHEALLTEKLIDGLSLIEGVRILGITDTVNFDDRVSTVSVHIPRHDPKQLARYLGDREIYVWDGHNYALTVIEAYGLSNEGGVLRFGPVHYNTSEEIDLTVATLADAIHSGIALRK
jgi:cysteine desulfurase family protein (TIGR01976 family)